MTELLSTHLETLIAFVTGGGLLTILTIRATKKKAEAHAMRAVQEVYQETIKDLRQDKEQMKQENQEFREKIAELRQKVNQISLDLAAIHKYKCTVLNCKLRQAE